MRVIWEAEVDAKIFPAEQSAIKAGASPDDPRKFAAYLHALRWGCVSSTDPTLFQAPMRAGIVPNAYQLEPLRKAMALPRVNLFIADDVGLGKTIEAGLVLQELLLRQRVERVVVVAPASVVLQWRDELGQRFGLSFAVMDKAYVNAQRRQRGFGVNPWTTHRHFLISHALLRDEDYLTGLRDWLDAFCPKSLLILDEAHVAAPASESKYAIDSQTTRAIRDVARRFEHRLFLSATPHNGHSNSFSALLEILDPQRFTRGVPVRGASPALKAVMVRRLKGDLRGRIASPIPERVPVQIDLDGLPADAPELVLAERLAEYSDILERRLAGAPNKAKAAGKLVTIALQKRLLSSIEAFARTLAVHRRSAEKAARAAATTPPDPSPQASLFDEAEELSEEQATELEELEVARATKAGAAAEDDARARALLDEMTAIAEGARDLPDAKVRSLLDWIAKNQCPALAAGDKKNRAPSWLPRRVLVFTEYADTKSYLVEQLRAAVGHDAADERVLTLHGGTDEEAREQVKQAFNADPAKHPVRILVATDAAREGINLQAYCHDLFHFDLPWNPARMEQRNGRIDRLLQPAKQVHCHYFFYPQRPEDAVLKALVEKAGTIQDELGSLADVVDRRLASMLAERRIVRSQAGAIADAIRAAEPPRRDVVEEELEPVRDDRRAKELEVLEDLLTRSRERLDLRPERLRDVVSVGLALAGAPGLTARDEPAGSYDVPPMDKLAGSDATWREIMDTLRAPRTRKMPEWEWRAESPPRPVSFEPATTLASETVQLHLAHKLTQRALAQFRSQAFSEDELSRVTVVFDPSHSRKRVLALGRLSVYGPGASRLHEEIVATAAYWSEGDDPARLKPFDSAAEERAFESLLAVLARPDSPPLPEHILEVLAASAAKDEEALWDPLRKRCLAKVAGAMEKLRRRGRDEAESMTKILEAQRSAIEKELKERKSQKAAAAAATAQPKLPFPAGWLPEEKDQKAQYEADTRHIEARLRQIDEELRSEPERIKAQYEVRHERLERVGLVYLWPTTS